MKDVAQGGSGSAGGIIQVEIPVRFARIFKAGRTRFLVFEDILLGDFKIVPPDVLVALAYSWIMINEVELPSRRWSEHLSLVNRKAL